MSLSKLAGIHAVQAALDYTAGEIHKVWLDKHRTDKKQRAFITQLQTLGINFEAVDRKQLDQLSQSKNHQGIVAEIELPSVRSEHELKQHITALTEVPLLLILDQVQDPHNLGACLRTADAVGVHGIIITKNNAVTITPTVCKVASGAAATVPVYQVTNLAATCRWLKQQNIWLMGAMREAQQSVFATDLTLPLALIMGAEGSGMRRLTTQQCDFLLNIPMQGQVASLNVSVAASIMLYEVFKQRL